MESPLKLRETRAFEFLQTNDRQAKAANSRYHRDPRSVLHAAWQAGIAGHSGNDGHVGGCSEVRRRVVHAHARAGARRAHRAVPRAWRSRIDRRLHRTCPHAGQRGRGPVHRHVSGSRVRHHRALERLHHDSGRRLAAAGGAVQQAGLKAKPEVGIQFGAGGATAAAELEAEGTHDVAWAIRACASLPGRRAPIRS